MDKMQNSDELIELLANYFKVLSEPTRLKIMHALQNEEMNVTELVVRIGSLQANVSKHLGILLEAGLVSRRKDGLSAYYSVSDNSVFDLCILVRASLERRLHNQHRAIKPSEQI